MSWHNHKNTHTAKCVKTQLSNNKVLHLTLGVEVRMPQKQYQEQKGKKSTDNKIKEIYMKGEEINLQIEHEECIEKGLHKHKKYTSARSEE